MTQPTEGTPVEGMDVTEEEIASAMGVNSVPDEVRTHSTFRDETDQVLDGAGRLVPPAEGEPTA